jgi:O-antigen ligase
MAFFVLASGIATLTAVDTGLSLSGFKKLFKIIIFFWVVNALATARPWELPGDLAGWFRLSKLKNCLEKGKAAFINKNPAYVLVGLLILAGVISAGVGIIQAVSHPEGIWNRYDVHGSLSNLMTYAQILMLITCMGLAIALFYPHRFRIMIWVGLMLMGFAILLTLNRQSWLGLFLAMTFLLFNKKRVYSLIPVFLAILVFIFGPQTLKNRMATMTDLKDYSVNERVLMWKAGWDILQDHPLTGCGFKCQFVIADRYPEHAILQKYTHMHNSPIQLAVDTGILGLTAWISIWIGFFLSLTRQLKHIPKNSSDYVIAGGSGAAAIAFRVAGLFENNFYDSEIVILMYFIMALPFVSSSGSQSAFSESAPLPHSGGDLHGRSSP